MAENVMKTQDEMNVLVPAKLKEIEEQYDVEILWAVESGSRAWGFASPDSDFDVRFIYKRKPKDYLKLNKNRDVIEEPVDDVWDVNGWDLDKTLTLLMKCNPTLYEWLSSPIRYMETDFAEKLKPIMDAAFAEDKILYHYLSTAKGQMKRHLKGDMVRPKKYFYAIRPILACRWVMKYHTAPPVLFDTLVEHVLPEYMRADIDALLALKTASGEAERIQRMSTVDEYIDQEIAAVEEYLKTADKSRNCSWEQINEFFWNEINE